MNIQDVRMRDLVPVFMRDDATVRGLCAAADAMFAHMRTAIYASWWRRYIENLESDQLDELAKQIGVLWYDDESDTDAKRKALKNHENVLAIAGTPEAVKNAVKDLFGEVDIVEWSDYDGAPYHFKLLVNAKLTADNTSRFETAVASAKNVRSIIDSLESVRKAETETRIGAAFVHTYVCEIT